MRYLAVPPTLLLLVLAACEGPGPLAPPMAPHDALLSRSAGDCTNLSGSVSARFVEEEDWDIEGDVFDDEGLRIGGALAWIDELTAQGNGGFGVRMRHRYLIDGSALDTEDAGVLSPTAPPVYGFNNRLEVVGGTHAFDGATGFIRSHGEVDFGTGRIELRYHGRICA